MIELKYPKADYATDVDLERGEVVLSDAPPAEPTPRTLNRRERRRIVALARQAKVPPLIMAARLGLRHK